MRRTHWQVITGAPCSGKTAVICELERRGFRVAHEAARAHIDAELKSGKTLAEIKADPLAFERHILYAKIRREAALPDRETVFLDRAVPDSIAYYRLEGLCPEDPLARSRLVRYQNIFFFERLRLEPDRVRTEDDALAERLDHALKACYRHLGYVLRQVPILSVKDRADFILQHL